MKFGHFHLSLLFFFLPLIIGILFWHRNRRKKAWTRLSEANLRMAILPNFSTWRWKLKSIFKVLVFIFLVVALMEPQWGMKEEEVKMRGVNIMLLADVSSSMLAQDIKPDRLQREKRKIRDLIKMLKGDRVGLIAFAGRSFLLSPLTVDYGTLDRYIDELSTETIPVKGTDLAGALHLALKTMPEGDEGKAIIIFTDGEDHSHKMKVVLKELEEKGVKVFVLGIGTSEGAPIPEIGGGFKINLDGETVVSKLKENFLKNLALGNQGAYVRTVTSDEDLKELYLKGIRGVLDPSDLRLTRKKIWESRFYWPLGIALIFLILERLISEGGKRKKKDSYPLMGSN